MAAERSRFSWERKQAIENADGLEDELETAQTTIARLEREKVEGAEKTKREMDHFRQSRHRALVSERGRLFVSAARRFDKFWKYKADRDKLEDKRLLYSQASGTLQSMDRLEKWGIPVPKKLKDILSANEVKFKKEVEEIVVKEITEGDLALTPPRPEPSRTFNIGTVGLIVSASLRSPISVGASAWCSNRKDSCRGEDYCDSDF